MFAGTGTGTGTGAGTGAGMGYDSMSAIVCLTDNGSFRKLVLEPDRISISRGGSATMYHWWHLVRSAFTSDGYSQGSGSGSAGILSALIIFALVPVFVLAAIIGKRTEYSDQVGRRTVSIGVRPRQDLDPRVTLTNKGYTLDFSCGTFNANRIYDYAQRHYC